MTTAATDQTAVRSRRTRIALVVFGLLCLAGAIVWASAASNADTFQPGQDGATRTTVVVNAAIIVFREGLEAVLIFAAVTASFLGAHADRKKPVVAGAAAGFAATVVAWFAAQWILSNFTAQYGNQVQAITGLIAVLVLLLVLNWFFHKIYWTGFIAHHHRRRRELLASDGGRGGVLAGQLAGLLLLGFTAVFREGFEVVLFLQNLQVQAGTATVLEGVAIGLLGTAAVGSATFVLQRKLPYKKMLIVTGVMIGFVLVVMIGGTARTFQDLGWLPTHSLGVRFPDWTARWFEVVPTVETIAVQLAAVVIVVGSYVAAEYVKVRRPKARGQEPARRAEAPVVEPARTTAAISV